MAIQSLLRGYLDRKATKDSLLTQSITSSIETALKASKPGSSAPCTASELRKVTQYPRTPGPANEPPSFAGCCLLVTTPGAGSSGSQVTHCNITPDTTGEPLTFGGPKQRRHTDKRLSLGVEPRRRQILQESSSKQDSDSVKRLLWTAEFPGSTLGSSGAATSTEPSGSLHKTADSASTQT